MLCLTNDTPGHTFFSVLLERMNAISESGPALYHATGRELPIGSILRAAPRKAKLWFNDVLETYRPEGMIPHDEALFLTDMSDPKLLVRLGVDWTYCYRVEPLGPVEKHNLGWLDEIHWRLSHHSLPPDAPRVRNATMRYWSGAPYPQRRVQRWEYLAREARVVALESHNPWEEPKTI